MAIKPDFSITDRTFNPQKLALDSLVFSGCCILYVEISEISKKELNKSDPSYQIGHGCSTLTLIISLKFHHCTSMGTAGGLNEPRFTLRLWPDVLWKWTPISTTKKYVLFDSKNCAVVTVDLRPHPILFGVSFSFFLCISHLKSYTSVAVQIAAQTSRRMWNLIRCTTDTDRQWNGVGVKCHCVLSNDYQSQNPQAETV